MNRNRLTAHMLLPVVVLAVTLVGCSGAPDNAATRMAPAGAATAAASPSASEAVAPTPVATAAAPVDSPAVSGAAVEAQVSSVTVNPGIGSATVLGVIVGVAEDGGDCLYVFTSDGAGHPVVAPGVGMASGESTTCGPVEVAPGQLSAGHWNVVLAYRSGQADVQSAPFAVDVP